MSRRLRPTVLRACCLAICLAMSGRARAAEPLKVFFRGLNLNGPAVTIDGHAWDGHDSKQYVSKDKSFENQSVALDPPTDEARAKMIRSSRWGGNEVALTEVPEGTYAVYLYVWEDNNPETFSIAVNGRQVVAKYTSGPAGHWDKLGPWITHTADGAIKLTSQGGAANFSGVEVWRYTRDALAAEPSPAGIEFFEKRIRPMLVKHCYECHSGAQHEVQGDLHIDTRAGMRKGGDKGPAVVPGDIEQSLLVKAVKHLDEDLAMPPSAKLSDVEIADLEAWIAMGAPDPRKHALANSKRKIDLTEARKFWSFQPVADPAVPEVADQAWPLGDVDRFLLAELEKQGLKPLPEADKRTWIRRATYDLTGLPPKPAEIESFLADGSPAAYAGVIDRLLASPAYGERWGRHWMDLVRYADTAGDNSDYPIPQAYRYRNYVIDSLNRDKPYDQFLREQIAGDLLPAANDAERNERVIATGYLAISRRFGSLVENYPQHLTIEDTIDNLGRTVLGLSINCARCHDHKFDPILQDDYYGLYGIFDSTRYPFPGIELEKKPRDFVPLFADGKPSAELAYAMAEGKPADAKRQVLGDPRKLSDVIPRKFPEILGGMKLDETSAKASGRLQLAEWLTDRKNPLTARVMVNRIWQYHFGAGLVKTPSDFGARGQKPTHPELLDHLASRFMAEGWSIKQMHRRIMTSRAYRLASAAASDAEQAIVSKNVVADPSNAMHWRFTRRRLDAESLRDTLLAVSGQLDSSAMNEPHPIPPVEKWDFTQHHPFRGVYPSNRRSVYLMTARLNSQPFFTAFDGADRNASTPKRDSSVTTIQSLYLLNNDFVHQQSAKFAERLLAERGDDAARLGLAFESTIGRPPADAEREAAANYLLQIRERFKAAGTPGESISSSQLDKSAWESFARAMFRMNEFLYID